MDEYQDLELGFFTRGMTDYHLGAPKEFVQKAFNMFLTFDGRMQERPGSTFEHATITDVCNKTSEGIDQLVEPLYRFSGEQTYKLKGTGSVSKIFYRPNDLVTSHTELTGPAGNHLFPTSYSQFAVAKWEKQIFMAPVSETRSYPQKIFQNTGGSFKLVSAAMPSFTASTGSGGPNFDAILNIAMCLAYTYTVGSKTFTVRSAPSFSTAIVNGDFSVSPPDIEDDNVNLLLFVPTGHNWDISSDDFKLEYYRCEYLGSKYYLVTSFALNTMTFNGTGTFGTGGSYGTYRSYTKSNVAYGEDGALRRGQPLYTNDLTEPFGGGVTYQRGSEDPASDYYPLLTQTIVTPPLFAKHFHVLETGIAYRGNVQEVNYVPPGVTDFTSSGSWTDYIYQNRVYQSVPAIPDAQQADAFLELDDANTAISSYKSVPLFFTRDNCYRGEGTIDRFGNGVFRAPKIGHASGTSSPLSVVQTPDGVFYAGQFGFYWTNGYDCIKISDSINDTYASLIGQDNTGISGAYDDTNKRVTWSVSDKVFVLHLRYGVKPDAVFTYWGGYDSTADNSANLVTALPTTVTTNFKASNIVMRNGILHRADSRGYVFQFDPTLASDPRVVTSDNVSAWGTSPFLPDLRTSALDYGDRYLRKWTPSVVLKVRGYGVASASAPLGIFMKSDRDIEQAPKSMKQVRATVLHGRLLTQSRKVPSPGLRCDFRQFFIQKAFSVFTDSDLLGTAQVNATLKTALLTDALTQDWPTDLLDYYISFANDNYTKNFLITVRTADTLTFTDAGNVCPANGTYEWVIRGFPKKARFQIEDLTSAWRPMDSGRPGFQTASLGENG